MEIANIDKEIIHIFWPTWKMSMKCPERKWLLIILKVTKKTGFHLSLEDTIFEKPQGGTEGKIDPLPSRLRDKSQPIANIFCLLRAMF